MRNLLFGIGLLSVGCAPPESASTAPAQTCGTAEPQVGIITTLTFPKADENGAVIGADLDGVVTAPGDSAGCGKPDGVDAEGNPGVDNAFAGLIPALEDTEAIAATEVIIDLIKSGEILLMVEMDGLDDFQSDDCVDMELLRGSGDPLLSPEGEMIAGQTFGRDETFASSRLEGLELINGRLQGGPIEVSLAFNIFEYAINFDLVEVTTQVNLNEDGTFDGFFSGATSIDALLSLAQTGETDPEVYETLAPLLGVVADLDLDEDGTCEHISMAMGFEGVNGYIFKD